ncbi:MAG TPA: efflux RND transporter permease subunit, partial [Devosia sp.]|nr:efflux RND transporter permease subunit [Devosia sp.]
MMIMFGLILTVGMLVDAGIVVVEYAERKISEGLDRKEAFIRSARMMFWPIVSSTATTLAAFLPLLMWPGIVGKFMSYLPIMVIVTLSASLLTALIFLPVVGGFVARRKVSAREREAAQALSGATMFDITKVKGILGAYVRSLSFMVRRPLLSLSVGFGMVAAIFVTFAQNPTGMVAFPDIEPDYATVAITGRGNYSPVEIRDILIEVEQAVLPVKGIKDMVLNFGSNGAVARVPIDTIGNLQLEFLPYKDRRTAKEIFAEIRQRTADISGVGIEMVGTEEGPPTGKDINLRIQSTTYEALLPTVEKIRSYVEDELGDTIDVEDTSPLPGINWEIKVDREKAGRFGIGVRELSPYIQLVTGGVKIGSYRPDDATDELDIRVRLPKDERTFAALDSLNVATRNGLVPVSNFIIRKAVPEVSNIKRWDQQYYMSVLANVTGNNPETGEPILAQTKVDELRAWVESQDWPKEITFKWAGADEQTQETNAFMMQAGMGALFLMFLILLTQFNSFYQVFVTLSTVVMSTAGVLLGMLITRQPFSAIMTGIGIVSLAGVVVNNSIVLIDTYNRLKSDGVEPITAILMTAAQRTRPVILTTVTTIFGLMPMAMGISIDFFARTIELGAPSGKWWISLSTALVSGLAFSTILTLALVPVMIVAPHVWKQKIKRLGAWIGGLLRAIGRPFRR